jgi:NAD(P) transhydrogenase subunit alpha
MDMFTLITIFVLSMFLGFELITKIPPTLHTPLMSGSNAISGITMVGAIISSGIKDYGFIQVFGMDIGLSSFLGFLALIFATINVVGGFATTDMMDRMFKKK